MKLFAINMVANNLFGRFNNPLIRTATLVLRSFSSHRLGVREKKATSAPEIKADRINNKTTKKDWMSKAKLSFQRLNANTFMSSGSNQKKLKG